MSCITFGERIPLANIIEIGTTTTILDTELFTDKYNIILVTEPLITITLPPSTSSKVVLVQQGFEGEGEFTICKT